MQNDNYRLTVNEQFDFDFSSSEIQKLDAIALPGNKFHILKNGESHHAELIDLDFSKKTVHLKINGQNHLVQIADQFDILVKNMGLNSRATHKINEIKAPMPGLVLSIAVGPGQVVAKGDLLLILEAMKMENAIKATGEGKVKRVIVSKGAPVDKGEILIEME